MPWRSDSEEEQPARHRLERADLPVLARKYQIEGGGPKKEDERDQSFGQHRKRERCPHCVRIEACAARRRARFERLEQAVERRAEQQRERDLGDVDACEEEDACRRKCREARVKRATRTEGLVSPTVSEQGEQKNSDGLREMGGEGIEAKDLERNCDQPVRQRRFLQVAYAVDLQGHPIAGEGDVSG